MINVKNQDQDKKATIDVSQTHVNKNIRSTKQYNINQEIYQVTLIEGKEPYNKIESIVQTLIEELLEEERYQIFQDIDKYIDWRQPL